MATNLLPTPRDHAPLATTAGPAASPARRVRLLPSRQSAALFAPLLLFLHGILGWVDSIGAAPGSGGSIALQVAGQAALVASIVGFGALGVMLARGGGLARGSYPLGSLSVAVLGAALVVLPLGLLPLGALLVLIGLGPLTQPQSDEPSTPPTGTPPVGQPLT